MYLIVGLGNPGNQYKNTRHNTGFELLDNYAKNKNIEINKNKFNGLYNEIMINGTKAILLKPQLYMNLSGIVVEKFVSYYKIPIKNILVIHDDLDMPVGKIKLKVNTSSGGHNGLKNIEEQLGSRLYNHLKIGISNNKSLSTADYVLGTFSKEEQLIIISIQTKVNNIIDDFLQKNFEVLMNKYNQK